MIKLIKKYKEIWLYILFGIATTLVNIIAYYSLSRLGFSTAISTVLAWIVSVIFAFFTNRKYVFNATENSVLKQILGFFSMRILTGVIDLLIMVIFVDVLSFNGLLIKLISNVLVIVLNYVFSKFFVFKNMD